MITQYKNPRGTQYISLSNYIPSTHAHVWLTFNWCWSIWRIFLFFILFTFYSSRGVCAVYIIYCVLWGHGSCLWIILLGTLTLLKDVIKFEFYNVQLFLFSNTSDFIIIIIIISILLSLLDKQKNWKSLCRSKYIQVSWSSFVLKRETHALIALYLTCAKKRKLLAVQTKEQRKTLI